MTTTTEKAIMVPMEVKYIPAWLTWVGSTATCLNAMGIKCGLADVAGNSGYAFTMSVHKGMCPSGPTVFNWGSMLIGTNNLGRSTELYNSGECFEKEKKVDRTLAHAREMYEFVEREITAGRPVVIWGTYVPEFGVAVGIEDGKYHVKSFKEVINQDQPPIAYDDLAAPGGMYALAFPNENAQPSKQPWPDQFAITQAVQLLHQRSLFKDYRFGLKAYDPWIAILEAGPDSPDWGEHTPFGNAYTTQCWGEAKSCALAFLKRVRERCEFVKEPLGKAIDAYMEVSEHMKVVCELFPFPAKDEMMNEETRKKAVDALKVAQAAEIRGAVALIETAESDWPKPVTKDK